MNPLDLNNLKKYVKENIVVFHESRISCLRGTTLTKLVAKNPYLFRAKNIVTAGDYVSALLDARLSSSEEKIFGDFLEELAIYVASITTNGHKSAASGMDLEFENDGIYYLISIKSGTNWGNSSQQSKLKLDFKNAIIRLSQNKKLGRIEPVEGICYGKTRTTRTKGHLKIVGQSFWYLISENPNLYIDIIDPLGHQAEIFNNKFLVEKAKITNLFTKEFIENYCLEDGSINWEKLVKLTCGNLEDLI